MNSCANVLPGDLRDRMKCSVLATESEGPGACISKPGNTYIFLKIDKIYFHAIKRINILHF